MIKACGALIESMRGTFFATRLSRRIRWMNGNLNFANPLDIGRAAAALAGLGETAALLVLKRLAREVCEGAKVEKPTDWVADVARRVKSGTAATYSREQAVGLAGA